MKKLFLITLVLVTLSCKQTNVEPTFSPTPTFTVVNNEETMPVWINGKSDATCILLVVHGGPGADVLDFRNYQNGTGFKKIEEQFLVAYWQQRASGQSYGSDNSSLFTIAQYVQDLDKVVDEIKTRYPNKKIALFGHSWGGTLTSSYLKDATQRTKIAGWIDAAGVTDGTTMFIHSRNDVKTEADYRISINENVSYWQGVKAQLQNPNMTDTDANALSYSVLDKIPQVTTKVNTAEFGFTKRSEKSNSALFPNIELTDNSSSLLNFNKPALMLWGKYDFAVSKKIRDKAILNLKNSKVTNVEFQQSGHFMMFHEPNLFATTMMSFLSSL